MSEDILERSRAYLAANAAESGADVLIAELIDEVDRLRRQVMGEVSKIISQVMENKRIIDDANARIDALMVGRR